MKTILFLIVLVSIFFVALGCEHNINSNDNHSDILISNVRSVADDPVIDCVVEQVHQHNGNYYAGHYNNDIHRHHGLTANDICTINSCDKTSLHEHNGIHYAGHHGSDGHHNNGHN
jgi:hypothetical protein